MPKLLRSLCFIGFITLALHGCNDDTQTFTKVRIGLAIQPSTPLIIIAQKKGFFRAAKLDVIITSYPSGRRAFDEGLLKNKLDIASSANTPVALAAINQQPITILAEISSTSNINRLVARKDRGINNLKDLPGKTIGTQKNSAVHYFLNLLLQQQNLTEHDLSIVFMQAEDLPEALMQGKIDAFSMREPYVSQAVKLMKDNTQIFSSPGLMQQSHMLVANQSWLKQNPNVGLKLMTALYQAEQFTQKHPEQTLDIMAAEMNISAAKLALQIKPYQLRLGLSQRMILEMESQSQWLIKQNQTQKPLPNFLHYIDSNPLTQVKPNAVSYIHKP